MTNCPAPALPTLEELIADESTRELWAEYLDGGWVRGTPDEPGVYQVATAEGVFVGYKEYILRHGAVVDKYQGFAEPAWQGYVWSRALPPPPIDVEVDCA